MHAKDTSTIVLGYARTASHVNETNYSYSTLRKFLGITNDWIDERIGTSLPTFAFFIFLVTL